MSSFSATHREAEVERDKTLYPVKYYEATIPTAVVEIPVGVSTRSAVTHGAQDYACPRCGAERHDVRALFYPVPEERRRYKGEEAKVPILCAVCLDEGLGIVMDWIPRRAQHDLLTGGTGLSVDIDGQVHTFSSTHEMRQFESESQRRAANGEGQAFSFRALSQNRGNMDRNTLSGSTFEKNTQVPHDQLGKTSRDRKIGRGVLTREQAERMAGGRG